MGKNVTDLKIEAIEKETRGFVCPNCKCHLQFRVGVVVTGVQETLMGAEMDVRDGRTRASQADIEIITQAEKLGILGAFKTACENIDRGPKPSRIEKHFLTFLEQAQRADFPQFGLRMALPHDQRGGELEAYTMNNIACILSDGYFKAFMPVALLKGEVLKPLTRSANIKSETITLEGWVKTRNGYVSSKGMLFSEMRKSIKDSSELGYNSLI